MRKSKNKTLAVVLSVVLSLSLFCFVKPAEAQNYTIVLQHLAAANGDLHDAFYWAVQSEQLYYDNPNGSLTAGQNAVNSVVYAFEDSVRAFEAAYDAYYYKGLQPASGYTAMERIFDFALSLFDCAVSAINALASDSDAATLEAVSNGGIAAQDLFNAVQYCTYAQVGL